MLREIDESWMKLIKMGRIHRGNRLLAQINFFKKCETFCEHEPSLYCNDNQQFFNEEKGEKNYEYNEQRSRDNNDGSGNGKCK
ncbi:hypothetical protein [Butyrivibrio sp. AD3002]|uniref:hypothetical protein n=1 Tax=Butyrivibrio sp. AD3002 TaxID=1280670 RepID=UPI0003B5E20F|nr:hypothetical protein [Butyrivibrio sp. AD3002]